MDRALANLASYQWLVFTSANGVHFFMRRLLASGRDLRALGSVQLAVIGPATADALREYHLEPDLIPPQYRSESLAAALKDRVTGQRMLLARADRGRDLLREELSHVAEVEQIAVYSQVDAVEIDLELLDEISQGRIDYITLTSSKIAEALIRLLDPAAPAPHPSGRREAGEHQSGDKRGDSQAGPAGGGGGDGIYDGEGRGSPGKIGNLVKILFANADPIGYSVFRPAPLVRQKACHFGTFTEFFAMSMLSCRGISQRPFFSSLFHFWRKWRVCKRLPAGFAFGPAWRL